jgi:hypothetical protein
VELRNFENGVTERLWSLASQSRAPTRRACARPDSAATCRPCFTPVYGCCEFVTVDPCLIPGPSAHSVARAPLPGSTCDKPRAHAGHASSHGCAASRARACRRLASPAAPYNGPHNLVRAVLAPLGLFASRASVSGRDRAEPGRRHAALPSPPLFDLRPVSQPLLSSNTTPYPSNTSHPSSPSVLAAIAGALNSGGRRLCAPPWAARRRRNRPDFAT